MDDPCTAKALLLPADGSHIRIVSFNVRDRDDGDINLGRFRLRHISNRPNARAVHLQQRVSRLDLLLDATASPELAHSVAHKMPVETWC